MSQPASEDPFLAVQKEVQTTWTSISADFDKWRLSTASSKPAEASSRELLKNQLHTIDWDIQDLQEAVRVAKDDPHRFSLTPQQVAARERFVSEMTRNVQGVREALGGVGTGEAVNGDRRDALLVDVGLHGAEDDEKRGARDSYVDDEMQQQERIIEQQDEDLDHLASAVERIGLMGHEMHQELSEHGEMLEGLDEQMDSTQTKMAAVREKLDRFVAATGPREFCMIMGLCLTFLILTVLVVIT